MRRGEEQSLSDLLKALIKQNAELGRGLQEMRIHEAWQALFGVAMDKYISKFMFQDGTLYIRLNSSTMIQEFAYRKKEIINRLNRQLGEFIVLELVIT